MSSYNGRFLREAELRALGLGQVGDNVAIHDTCVLVGTEQISLGSNIRIDPFCVITAAGGWLRVGDFVHVGSHCSIAAASGVELADFAGLSAGVRIFSRSDDYSGKFLTNPTVPPAFTAPHAKLPVRLGRHVIVGAGAVILPEAELSEGAVVGAGALVNRSLAAWGIYAGSPARRIGDRHTDLLADETRLRSAIASNDAILPVSGLGEQFSERIVD